MDGEDIDMPRGDLKRMVAVVEKRRMAAIEYDRGTVIFLRSGHRLDVLKQGVRHSWATSLA